MSHQESNAYILGTEREELHRLGTQHQVWAEEARVGWRNAGFSAGQSLLDLGCGPGFCTQDLAYIAGDSGSVIGVDQSAGFIDFARSIASHHGLSIDYRVASFDDMVLDQNSLDGIYCRWALAWVPNPEEIVEKLVAALRPGGVFLTQEYYDWQTFRTQPEKPELAKAVAAAYRSFEESVGDIDVGRKLPGIFAKRGLRVAVNRPMSKLALPNSLTWQWPTGFFGSYLPKVAEAGLISEQTLKQAQLDWDSLGSTPGASCQCPQMVEVIGVKI